MERQPGGTERKRALVEDLAGFCANLTTRSQNRSWPVVCGQVIAKMALAGEARAIAIRVGACTTSLICWLWNDDKVVDVVTELGRQPE